MERTFARSRQPAFALHRNLHIETLESRRLLCGEAGETFLDSGNVAAVATRVSLLEPRCFEGVIATNDLDFYRVEGNQGDVLTVQVRKSAVEMEVSTRHSTVGLISATGVGGPPNLSNPERTDTDTGWMTNPISDWSNKFRSRVHLGPPDSSGGLDHGTFEVMVNVAVSANEDRADDNLASVIELSMGMSSFAEFENSPNSNISTLIKADVLQRIAIEAQSNYSGDWNTTFGNARVEQELMDRSVSGGSARFRGRYSHRIDDGSQQASEETVTWDFTPDPFEPTVGIFSPSGDPLILGELEEITSDTVSVELDEFGDWLIVVSKDSTFTASPEEALSYHRPYELELHLRPAPPVDLVANSLSLGEDGLQFDYQILAASPGLSRPSQIAFWWSGDAKWSSDDELIDAFASETVPRSDHKFRMSRAQVGTSFKAPDRHHKFLIAVIDEAPAIGNVKEINEGNNEASVEFLSLIDVGLELEFAVGKSPRSTAYLKEQLEVKSVVTNRSPIPLKIGFGRRYDTDVVGLIVPENHERELLISPGKSEAIVDTISVDWKWIPKNNPLKADVELIDELLGGLAIASTDLVGLLVPAKIDALISSLQTQLKLLEIDGLYDTQVLGGAIDIVHGIDLNLSGLTASDQNGTIAVRVPPDRLEAFDDFIKKWREWEASLLQISVSAPFLGSTIAELTRRLVIQTSFLDQEWRAAADPPDPNYRVFSPPILHLDSGLLSPNNPLSALAEYQRLLDQLEDAKFAAIDRKDGAIQAGDASWQAEQLLVISNLQHRNALFTNAKLAADAILSPLRDAHWDDSVTENAARLQRDGLASEAETVLLESGWSEEVVQLLDGHYKTVTEEDLLASRPSDWTSEAGLLNAIASAGSSLTYLSEAIRVRTQDLGLPIRALTGEEEALLTGYRQDLSAILENSVPDVEGLLLTERYASDSRRIAISSNNFDAIKDHLEFSYTVPLNAPFRFAKMATLADYSQTLVDNNEIDSDLQSRVATLSLEVDEHIASERWTEAEAGLDDLLLTVESQPEQTPFQKLKTYIQYLRSTLFQRRTWSPTITSTPSRLKAADRTVAPDASVSDPSIGIYSGGFLKASLRNAQQDDRLILKTDTSGLVELRNDLEVWLDSVLIGTVHPASTETELHLTLMSGADAASVSELLRHIEFDRADGSTAAVVLQVSDGTGAISPAVVVRSEGDFNSDGLLDASDIALLTAAVGSTELTFDITGDGKVDNEDRQRWIHELKDSFFGDANLDHVVDFSDFLILSRGFGKEAEWGDGDFSGDGEVNFTDFLLLSSNFGRSRLD